MRTASLGALCVCLALAVGCNGARPASSGCNRSPVTTESGLSLEDLECGTGAEATGGASVTVEYTARVEGEVFDSSSGEPLVFPLGRGQVIAGFDEGVTGMRAGGRRRLVIPPELAYGDAGFPPDVPPGATLVFDVELVEATVP